MKQLIPKRRRNGNRKPALRGESPFTMLHARMDDLFEEFFDTFSSAQWPAWPRFGAAQGSVSPDFEVSETDESLEIKAELPGLDDKDIEVILDDNVLTIRGEKKEEREEKEKDYQVSEVHYGHFSRVIPVPAGIDRERIKSTFKKGVLCLTLPKTEQAKSHRRRIEITKDTTEK